MERGDFVLSNVDKRVVEMQFDNKQFEKDMATTVKSLRGFEKELNGLGGNTKAFDGLSKGLNNVKSEVKGFNLGPVSDAFEKVKVTISGWEMVAMASITRVVNGAMNAAQRMARSLIVDPVSQGFSEYELKMNSIQTMMMGSGASLEEVNKKLDELNTYADKTIYSFSDMTQNIGKFINAGISLDDSVAAIQGVSNVAAISGANANEASRAMYNFAQALSSGYVKLIDWKSIENANMATVDFKQQLLNTAVALGTVTKNGDDYVSTTVDMNGKVSQLFNSTKGFNDSLSHQWMTTEVLTETLKKYTDETTALGKKAFAAAQDVKTFSQLMDTLKEAVGSGWAQTWEAVFGDFNEAKNLWTAISNVVGGFIEKQSNARLEILKTWKEMGGRNTLIESLKNAFDNIQNVINSVKKAFQEVFKPITGNRLVSITRDFAALVTKMELTEDELKEIKDVFKSVFSTIHNVMSPLITAWKEAFPLGTLITFVNRFVSLIGTVIKLITDTFNALTNNGEVIHKAALILFSTLSTGISILGGLFKVVKNIINFVSPIIVFLAKIIGYIADLGLSIASIVLRSKNLRTAIAKLSDAFEKFVKPIRDGLAGAFEKLNPYLDAFKDWADSAIGWLSDRFADAISTVAELLNALANGLTGSKSGFDNMSNGAKKAASRLDDFRNKVKGTVSSVVESIKKNQIISTIWNGVTKFFRTLWENVNNFVTGVDGTLSSIFKTFRDQGVIAGFVKIIKEVANGIGQGVKSIIKSAGPAKDALLEMFGADSVLDLIQKFVSIFAQLKLGSLAGSIGKFLDTLSGKKGLLTTIKDAFTSFTDGIKNALKSLRPQQSGLKNFATAVLMISASLYLISLIPVDDLDHIILSLIAVVLAFSLMMKGLNDSLNDNEHAAKDFAAMSLLIYAFSKAIKNMILGLSVLMLVVNNIKPESAKTSAIIVGVLATLIGAFAILFAHFAKSKMDHKQISAMSLLMYTIGKVIKSVALVIGILSLPIFDPGKLAIATLCVGGLTALIMILLGQLFAKGSMYGSKPAQISAMSLLMYVIGNAIKNIALVIGILSLLNTGKVVMATLCVGAITALIEGFVLLFSKMGSKLDPKQILSMSLMFFVIGNAIKGIAFIIAVLSLLNPAGLLTGITVIAGVTVLLYGLMDLSKKLNPDKVKAMGESIALMGASIALIAVSIKILSGLELANIGKAMLALVGSFAALGAIAVGISHFAKSMMALSEIFKAFGISAALMAASIYLIVRAVKIMNGLGPTAIQTMTDMITALVSNIPKWAGILITGFLDAFIQLIPSIAKSLVQAIVTIIETVTGSAATIVEAIGKLFQAIVKTLSSMSNAFDVKDLFWAISSIALIAGLIFVLQVLASDMKSALKGIALMAMVLGMLVASIAIMSSLPNADKISENLNSMAIAMLSLAGVFSVIAAITAVFQKIGGGKGFPLGEFLKVVVGFAAVILILVALMGVIGGLSVLIDSCGGDTMGWLNRATEVMTEVGNAIGSFLGAIIGSFLGLINDKDKNIGIFLGVAAMLLALEPMFANLPIITIGLIAMGGILEAIDAIGGTEALNHLLDLLKTTLPAIGEALGGFVGGIIGGILKTITSAFIESMCAFADGLSRFIKKLQPFLNAVQNIKPSVMEGIGSLTLAMLAMVATELLVGIANFFSFFGGAKLSFIEFAIEISKMAPYLVDFSNTLERGNFDGRLVESAANAALMMTEVANNLPREGGWWQKITGNNMDMGTFGSKLEGLGSSLVRFGREVSKLKPAQIEAMDVASDAIGKLVDIANTLPKEGGWWQKIVGETTDMDVFGTQLEGLGKSLVKFSKSVSELTPSQISSVETAVPIVQALVDIANKMPKEGGLWAKVIGDSMDIDEFGDKLETLGSGFASFATGVGDLKKGQIEKAKTAVEICDSLVSISNKLSEGSKDGGFASWFGGSSKEDIESWGEKLPALGEGFADFAEEVKDVKNLDNVSVLAGAIEALANAFQSTSEEGAFSGYYLGRLGDLVHGIGAYEGLEDFVSIANTFGESNTAANNARLRIKYVAESAEYLANMFQMTEETGAFSGTFLARLGDLIHGENEYESGDLLTLANLLGEDNNTAELASKRIIRVAQVLKALAETFQSTSDTGAFSGTFLARLGDLVHGEDEYEGKDLLTLANLLGEDNNKSELACRRIIRVAQALKALSEMFQSTSDAGAFSGTFLARLGDLIHGENEYESGDLLTLANLLGEDNNKSELACRRIIRVSSALKVLAEMFQSTSNINESPKAFLDNLSILIKGNDNYQAGDLLNFANLLGEDNSKVEPAYKRIVRVSDALKAIAEMFQSTSDAGAFSGTFLARLGDLIHGEDEYEGKDLLTLANLLGKDNSSAELACRRIIRVAQALQVLAEMFQSTENTGEFSGTFLSRVGKVLHGNNGSYEEGDLLKVADLLGKDNNSAELAYKRIVRVAQALQVLAEMFQMTSENGKFTGIFLDRLGALVNGNGGYYKSGDFIKASEVLGKDEKTTSASLERIKNVASAIKELSLAFESTANLSSEDVETFTDAINSIASVSIDTIKNDLFTRSKEVIDAAGDLIYDLGEMFLDRKEPLKNNVLTMLSAISQAITESKSKLTTEIKDMVEAGLNAVSSYNSIDMTKKETFYQAGINSITGYVNGIKNNLQMATKAGESIGKAAVEGTKKGLDSHSPSRIYENDLAYNAVIGFVNGFKKRSFMAFSAGEDFGQNAVNGTKGIVSRISDIINSDMNLQPIITPVLDLDEMTTQSQGIGGILNAYSSMNMASRASNLLERGRISRIEADISRSGSPDVVSAVENLTNRMDSLEEAILNRPINLDGERVSKVITPKIDKNLGRRALYSRRGN